MTRAEARGALQQLAKLWQGRLGEAIMALHEELSADVDLEAGVAGLRYEHAQLVAEIAAVRIEVQQAKDAAATIQAAVTETRALHAEEVRRLAELHKQAEAFAKQYKADLASAQREIAAAHEAWQRTVQRERATTLADIDGEVRGHRETLEAEITTLTAQRDALSRDLADVFSRYSPVR